MPTIYGRVTGQVTDRGPAWKNPVTRTKPWSYNKSVGDEQRAFGDKDEFAVISLRTVLYRNFLKISLYGD